MILVMMLVKSNYDAAAQDADKAYTCFCYCLKI